MPSTFSIRLPDDLHTDLERLAKATRRSKSFLIKEAVTDYVREHQQYVEAIDAAVAEADKGMFVSGEAVDKWLSTWGTENETPTPKPDVRPPGRS